MEQLSLLETPPPTGAIPVWSTLDAEQRARVVALLVRLMAKAIAAHRKAAAEEERSHE